MSAYVTKLPVDLESVKKLLPPGSDVESVEFNKDTAEVELKWGNDALQTPYSFHFDWPLSMLQEGKRPEIVKDRVLKAAEPVAAPAKKGKKK